MPRARSRSWSSFVRIGSVATCAGLLTTLATAAQHSGAAPIRVGVRARSGGADRLTPLRYIGGFETKTMLYETLVRRDEDGRIAPALARRWSVSEDGKTFRFELREGATFHDGEPVTAAAVATHFRRWSGLPEHDWLPVNRLIVAVEVESERHFTVELSQPYSLLSDLLAINPCAVVGPGARDWEGEFQRPIGTGPFRFAAALDGGKRWRLEPAGGDGPPLEVSFYPRGRDATPLDDLLAGTLEVFVGGWDEDLPADRLDALARDERFRVHAAPGSSVVYLSFATTRGPTADVAVRRRIAAAIDRQALVAEVEGGRAEPCTTWAAPQVAFWPRGPASLPRATASAVEAAASGERIALKIIAGRERARASRVAESVAGQLRRAGFDVEILTSPPREREAPVREVGNAGTVRPLTSESGEVRAERNRALRARTDAADIRIEITHGLPYCPHQSLVARFGPRPNTNEDEPRPRRDVDPELAALVAEAMTTPTEELCLPIYARIQDLMDRQALIVPLLVPHRVAVHTAQVDGIRLGIDVYHVDLTGLRRTDVPAGAGR